MLLSGQINGLLDRVTYELMSFLYLYGATDLTSQNDEPKYFPKGLGRQ